MSKDRTNTEKLYDIIKAPIITEKSMMATTLGQYTFEVTKENCLKYGKAWNEKHSVCFFQ